jgi:hypothetical protein
MIGLPDDIAMDGGDAAHGRRTGLMLSQSDCVVHRLLRSVLTNEHYRNNPYRSQAV